MAEQRDDVQQLREQIREDGKLLRKAADALAEIHRNEGLSDHHADVLTALRIRLEGKKRASLEELLTATKDLGKKDLTDALGQEPEKSEWPTIEEKKRDWPT